MKFKIAVITAATVMAAWSASANFVAYNDCVHGGSPANTTIYSAYMGDGGGFETPSGLLKDFATGLSTSVTATMSGANISGSISAAPNAGTDAANTFNGKVNLGDGSTSYNSSSLDWYYQVTFTGLDPTKSYEFVTTANRNSSSYAGSGASSRWTKFSIIGADAYVNSSSAGVTQISPDVVEFNTGYNTVNGYVARWTGITAADGSFTVISQNVGAGGPGDARRSYGMEGFMLAEVAAVPEPTTMIAGALLLLPFGASTLRLLRKRQVV
jgi:large repetitive protein